MQQHMTHGGRAAAFKAGEHGVVHFFFFFVMPGTRVLTFVFGPAFNKELPDIDVRTFQVAE